MKRFTRLKLFRDFKTLANGIAFYFRAYRFSCRCEDFIVAKGTMCDQYDIGITSNLPYRSEARNKLFSAVESNLYFEAVNTLATLPSQRTCYARKQARVVHLLSSGLTEEIVFANTSASDKRTWSPIRCFTPFAGF